MLLGSKIAVIGAGSLRAGAPVFASLANLPLAPETRLVLCDEFLEALDLFERLARVFAAANELEISISAVSDIAEAIKKLRSASRDREGVIDAARLAARRAATRWCGKRPQVRVLLAEG